MKTLDQLLHSHVVWAASLFGIMIIQNLIAEEIILTMKANGFKLGWFFGFLNAFTAFLMSYMTSDRQFIHGIQTRMTTEHVLTGCSYSVAQGMAGISTLYLRYNTVTVFKSSKVVFVMLCGHFFLEEPFTRLSLIHSFLMSFGLFVLSTSDLSSSKKDEREDSVFGIFLMVTSLSVSAFGSIIQQAVLQNNTIQLVSNFGRFVKSFLSVAKSKKSRYATAHEGDSQKKLKPSRKELKDDLLLYSSFITASALFIVCIVTDELFQGFYFFWTAPFMLSVKQVFALLMTATSQRLVLSLNQVYGATATQVLLTVRKVTSFVMSVFVFPKPFNMGHAFGALDVTVFAVLLQTHLMEVKRSRAKWKKNYTLRNLDIV